MLFIARRYLISKKSHSVVNIISMVSLFSLMIPTAAVIVLLSVFNGFGSLVGGLERVVEADLTISLREGKLFGESDLDSVAMGRVRGVEALSYVTEQMLLVEHGGENHLLTFRGVEPSYTSVLPVDDVVVAGRFELELGDLERAVLGRSVASQLGIRNLYEIDLRLYSLKMGRLQSMLPMSMGDERVVRLSGVVSLDEDSEGRYGYISRRLMNSMIGREGELSKVVVKVAQGADIKDVRRELQSVVGGEFKVESREELNPALYEIIRFEKLGVLMISSLVMILAAFSLVGALAMLIIEKSRDVMTLRAMGATMSMIERIFLLEGALLSGVAIAGGVALGILVTLIQHYFGVVELPISSMFAAAYPVELQLWDVVSVVVIALGISWVLCRVVVSVMMRRGERQ